MKPYFWIHQFIFRTTSNMRTGCKICLKMVCDGKTDNSPEKINFDETHSLKKSIPGLSTDSEIKKPTDDNLSPFQMCSLELIQYGETDITSISTTDPRWSTGVCLNISKYEGRFFKKKYTECSKVIRIIEKQIN